MYVFHTLGIEVLVHMCEKVPKGHQGPKTVYLYVLSLILAQELSEPST